MSKVTPKDLIPQLVELKIPGQESVFLRNVDIDDWSWMQKRFGDDIQKKLERIAVEEIMVIMYRLMRHEDKMRFRPEVVEGFTDDGDLIKSKFTGPQKLGKCFKGQKGILEALETFKEVMGVDKDAETEILNLGKGGAEKKQKPKPTGQKSTTSSEASTATP